LTGGASRVSCLSGLDFKRLSSAVHYAMVNQPNYNLENKINQNGGGSPLGKLSEELAKYNAEEAVAIGDRGSYCSLSREWVDIEEDVENAMLSTVSYTPEDSLAMPVTGEFATEIEVVNETTLMGASRLLNEGLNPVLLNFASAKNPGGGFLWGSQAQEEYLARASTLYHCLRGHPMYQISKDNPNGIYTDHVVYSPEVPVFRSDDGMLMDQPYSVSMITSSAVRVWEVANDELDQILGVMYRRICRVLAIGLEHGHDSIVLGAWGCGDFGNDPAEIAQLFQKAIHENFPGAYRHITFSILDWGRSKMVISPFEDVFSS